MAIGFLVQRLEGRNLGDVQLGPSPVAVQSEEHNVLAISGC